MTIRETLALNVIPVNDVVRERHNFDFVALLRSVILYTVVDQ